MKDHHARCLKEQTFVGVTVVVGVLVLFSVRESRNFCIPANAGQHVLFKKESALGFIVQNLCVTEVTHNSLILFSIQVTVENGHYSQVDVVGPRNRS